MNIDHPEADQVGNACVEVGEIVCQAKRFESVRHLRPFRLCRANLHRELWRFAIEPSSVAAVAGINKAGRRRILWTASAKRKGNERSETAAAQRRHLVTP